MALTRRGPIEPPRLSKLANLRQVAERQEAFNREVLGLVTGLPAGFGAAVLPLAVEGGAAASKGQETSGWAAANHQHPLNVTGSPGTVAAVSAQGNGPGVSLSGHTHRLGLLTTKGDMVGHDGSGPVRVPVGSDGYVPTVDVTAAPGWRWAQPAAGGGSGGGSGGVGPVGPSVQEQADLEIRAAFDSLALRAIVARTFR